MWNCSRKLHPEKQSGWSRYWLVGQWSYVSRNRIAVVDRLHKSIEKSDSWSYCNSLSSRTILQVRILQTWGIHHSEQRSWWLDQFLYHPVLQSRRLQIWHFLNSHWKVYRAIHWHCNYGNKEKRNWSKEISDRQTCPTYRCYQYWLY